jgi:hypothetical protein
MTLFKRKAGLSCFPVLMHPWVCPAFLVHSVSERNIFLRVVNSLQADLSRQWLATREGHRRERRDVYQLDMTVRKKVNVPSLHGRIVSVPTDPGGPYLAACLRGDVGNSQRLIPGLRGAGRVFGKDPRTSHISRPKKGREIWGTRVRWYRDIPKYWFSRRLCCVG